MADRQLFCVAEDRHRAALLVQLLGELNCPTPLASTPPAAPPESTLVLWTHNAAAEPWMARLFDNPDAIALVLDGVGLPARCTRAVDLSSWPARSADARIGELTRWLANPGGHPGFARVTRRAAAAEPGSGSAVLVLMLVGVLLGLLVWSVAGENGDAESAGSPGDYAAPDVAGTSVPRTVRGGPTGTGRGTFTGGRDSIEADRVVGTDATSADGVARQPGLREPPAGGPANSRQVGPAASPTRLPKARVDDPVVTSADERLGNGSLAHLCRARSLAAARAWYGVLTAQQRRRAATMDCVRELLAKPEFAALKESIQA